MQRKLVLKHFEIIPSMKSHAMFMAPLPLSPSATHTEDTHGGIHFALGQRRILRVAGLGQFRSDSAGGSFARNIRQFRGYYPVAVTENGDSLKRCCDCWIRVQQFKEEALGKFRRGGADSLDVSSVTATVAPCPGVCVWLPVP